MKNNDLIGTAHYSQQGRKETYKIDLPVQVIIVQENTGRLHEKGGDWQNKDSFNRSTKNSRRVFTG